MIKFQRHLRCRIDPHLSPSNLYQSQQLIRKRQSALHREPQKRRNKWIKSQLKEITVKLNIMLTSIQVKVSIERPRAMCMRSTSRTHTTQPQARTIMHATSSAKVTSTQRQSSLKLKKFNQLARLLSNSPASIKIWRLMELHRIKRLKFLI